MQVLPIRLVPDPVLRRKAKRVRGLDGPTQRLIDEMIETMRDAYGVGLAAPQVGKLWRIIVIELPGEEVKTLINPEVVKKGGERVVEEGCLSIPGYRGEIKRSVSVTAKGYNRQGKEIRLRGKELLAQALEHEIDHLNGVLYIDYLESPDKLYKIDWEQAGL